MKLALIGMGYWGKNLARVIQKNSACELYAIADISQDAIHNARIKYPAALVFNSYHDLLAMDEIDAVVISTPVSTHFDIVKDCLNAGKHVLCEKPLSTSQVEFQTLKQISNEKNVIMMAGYTFLYNSVVNNIKIRLNSGKSGKPYYATFKRTGLGPVRNDTDVINDLAVHDISIAIHWFGMPVWAKCDLGILLKNKFADIGFIQLGYPDGFIVNIHVSWLSPMKQRVIEVVCENEMLVFDDLSPTEKLKIIERGTNYFSNQDDFGSFQLSIKDGDVTIPNIDYPEPLMEELSAFILQIRNNKIDNYKYNIAEKVSIVIEMIRSKQTISC
jgi:predicted dehydrogenase